jgi:RNA polymerase sigma factor (sigma-70 family)
METAGSSIDPLGSVTLFFGKLQAGDPSAATALWERFVPRLVGLARKTLAGKGQRVADAEDAVQSAFASFCIRAKAGEFQITDRSDLWNLMGVITANKARMQVRRESAGKRGGGRVVGEAALARPDGSPLPLDEAAAALHTAEFDLQCEDLLNQLDPELQEIAVLRLLGFRNSEIAERQDCTERRIERKLNLIRAKWSADTGE